MIIGRKTGFTIVELLVVISVIGIIASITLVAYNGVQARARDANRRSDLDNVADALSNYWADKGNVMETGSGCGYAGFGNGWLTYEGGSYTKSVVRCLKEAGYLSSLVQDPIGGQNGTSTPSSGYAYMKYHCGTGDTEKAYVYAKLETLPQSSTATDSTCNTTADTSYGMNYFVEVK